MGKVLVELPVGTDLSNDQVVDEFCIGVEVLPRGDSFLQRQFNA